MLLVALSLVLMPLDHRQHHLESIRAALSTVMYPLQYVASLPASISGWASESLASRNTLLKENRELRREQLELKTRLLRFNTLKSENARLRELLHSSKRVGENVLIGELLAVDQDPFKRLILINKGRRDSVYVGQPLLDAYGIMGQVIHVSQFSSTGILITDPSHAIPIQDNRNGMRGIAVGTGSADQLSVPNIPNNADIKVGDELVTSGLGQRFPAGYPVARITSIKRDPSQPYAQITAEPLAHLERSREVLLVIHHQKQVADLKEEDDSAKGDVK